MKKNLYLITFLILCLGLSSCASKPYAKTDFSKKIETKHFVFPDLKQSNKDIGLGSFVEHPDLEIRKDYVTYRKTMLYMLPAYYLGLGSLVYGLAADEAEYATYGYVGMISVFAIIATYSRLKTLRMVKKHNKRLEGRSTLLVPSYNPEVGTASINTLIRF